MLVNEREVDILGLDGVGATELVAKDEVDPVMEVGGDVVTFQHSEDIEKASVRVYAYNYCSLG